MRARVGAIRARAALNNPELRPNARGSPERRGGAVCCLTRAGANSVMWQRTRRILEGTQSCTAGLRATALRASAHRFFECHGAGVSSRPSDLSYNSRFLSMRGTAVSSVKCGSDVHPCLVVLIFCIFDLGKKPRLFARDERTTNASGRRGSSGPPKSTTGEKCGALQRKKSP